jgi:hypothetical protein
MAQDLLLHSMAEFECLTLPLLEIIRANQIAEIGTEQGGNSRLLAEWLAERDGQLYSIDPKPSQAFIDWVETQSGTVKYIPELSLAAIPTLGTIDAWFIDGDHNWYTVFHELQAITTLSQHQQHYPLIFLHDVCWPCQARDLYYAPSTIPTEHCHPYSYDKGVTLDNPQLIAGGFRGHGQYALALQEGGEQNGVLTAVHDFMATYPEQYALAIIPAVLGLGILYNKNHPCAQQIAALISPYDHNPLLKILEKNRLANYLKVIEWQDRFAATEIEIESLRTQLANLAQQKNSIKKRVTTVLRRLYKPAKAC